MILTLLPAAMINPTPTEAIPKPPICMSAATIACPIAVKLSAVSTTTSPVTQTALVDVKINALLFSRKMASLIVLLLPELLH